MLYFIALVLYKVDIFKQKSVSFHLMYIFMYVCMYICFIDNTI